MGLCGPEDVMDGPGRQHLPHGFVDDLLVLATAHRHRAQEAHGKHLLQERVYGNTQVLCAHKDIGAVNMQCHKRQDIEHLRRSGPLGCIYERRMLTVNFC